MKDYEYKGETFHVDGSSGCEIKVSNKLNTISIALNTGGPSVYKVSTVKGGWWWHTNSVKESINRACLELVEARMAITPEAACNALSEFVKSL